MKIETFHTLEGVLQTGTFAGAARQANVTPSAVSMQMKQLEQYLGKPLFDRSGLQARPNQLAHEVAETMRQALQNLIESLQPVVLPGIVRYVRERHPKLELRLVRGRSSTLTASVKAGDIDAALVAQPAGGGSARLRWTPMMRRELMLIAPPASTETNVASLFRLYDWIRYDRNTVSGAMAAQYVHTHVSEIRGMLEFDSAPAIVAMVSAGLGVSILQGPDPTLVQNYPVRLVRLGRAAPVLTLSMVTRKGDDDNRSVAAVRDAMRMTLASYQRQSVAARH